MPADILYLALICAATIFGFWITLWLISLAIDDSSIGDPLYPVGMAITASMLLAWFAMASTRRGGTWSWDSR